MKWEKELQIGLQAVHQASLLCKSVQRAIDGKTQLKADLSPVTVADYGAQTLITRALHEAFPHDPILAEEDAEDLRGESGAALLDQVFQEVRPYEADLSKAQILDILDSTDAAGGPNGRFWTIDPIDGTKGYLQKKQFAIALALIEEGKVVLGLLACPSLSPLTLSPEEGSGCVLLAVRGQGAEMISMADKKRGPIQVTPISSPAAASFCEPVDPSHSSHDISKKIAETLGVQAAPFRLDSQCKYAAVARGSASVYLRLTRSGYTERIWDHAAGSIIVEEAGGKVSDVSGRALDFSLGAKLQNNQGVVVTNGLLHDQVLEAIQSVLAPGSGNKL